MSRVRPQIIIVGAGLGGCLAAHGLTDFADVTLVEQGPSDGLQLVDHDVPVGIAPYAGSGLGGATRFWHNGLIEAPERAFRDWPFAADVLDPWLEESHRLLGSTGREAIAPDIEALKAFAQQAGVSPSLLRHKPLFYPGRRNNVWETLGLARRVKAVRGYVDELNLDSAGRIASVGTRTVDGRRRLPADIVILAAGGLGTPGLLQLLRRREEKPIAAQAGQHYDDHPSAFVAEFSASAELGRLWNYESPATGGTISLPLTVETPECYAAFYVRPAAQLRQSLRHTRYREARDYASDHPWSPVAYARMARRSKDVLGLVADRAGLAQHPTRFNLFLLAGIPPSEDSRVWRDDAIGPVHRNWHIDPERVEELRQAASTALGALDGIIHDVRIYDGWHARMMSGAHHSGTARLAARPDDGVCDPDGRVFEVPNLYVSDGSLIPQSGYANTGLTIGALGLRLGEHLKESLR